MGTGASTSADAAGAGGGGSGPEAGDAGAGGSGQQQVALHTAPIKFRSYKQLLNTGQIYDFYTKGELLGSGNMASVFRYTRKRDKVQLAAKVVEKKTLTETTEFTNELEILAACGGHKHILDLHDIFEDQDNFYLLTDLLEGGELFDRICDMGVYTEAIAKNIIRPILDALRHIHSRQVLHRDVKPENLLLMTKKEDALLKIADFGVAAWLPDLEKSKYPKCGTPEYLAPEMYGPRGCSYGKPVDVWALGCVIFIMLCGWHPFQTPDNLREQRAKIIKGDLTDLEAEDITADAKDVIRKMLEVDPAKRWTIEQLFDHPWVRDPNSATAASAQAKPLKNAQKKIRSFLNQRLRKVVLGMAFASSLRQKSSDVDDDKQLESVEDGAEAAAGAAE
jgi:serine/threonine protein kinase